MNQIFRVIWNHATQSWVAVSELTKAHKKQSRNSLKAVLGGALVLLSINTAEAAAVGIESTNGATIVAGDTKTGPDGVSIGVGTDTSAGANNVAIGKNAKVGNDAKGRTQPSGQSVAIGGGNLPHEGARALGQQSVAIGGNTIAEGNSSIAIGNDDVDAAVTVSTTYTNSDGNTVRGTIGEAYTNLTGKNLHTDGGRYKDTKSGEAAVAIGVKAQAGDISVALGTGAAAEKVNAVALGSGASATFDNSVALGGGSTTDKEGTKQTSVTVNGHTYNWSGGSTTSKGDVVSIGKAGYERQLKNVAAGEVSETSTDGINGSQLYGILNNMTIDPTFLYAGDDANKGEVTGADADAKKADAKTKKIVVRSMKDGRLNLLGGATGELSDNNIGVNYDNENTIKFKLAKALTGLTSTDVGGIVTNAGGINMNNKSITNLAAGTNSTDAVNKSQLDKVATNNIKLGGDSGTTDAQQLDKTGGLQFNVKGTNGLTTTASGTDVTVKLDDATKAAVDSIANKIENNKIKLSATNDSTSTDQQDLNKSGGIEFKVKGDNGLTASASGDTVTLKLDDATKAKVDSVDSKIGDNNISLGSDSGSTDAQALTNTGGMKFNIKGENGLTTTASGKDVTVKLDDTTKDKIDNAADKDLSNITPAGKKQIKDQVTWKAKANNSGIALTEDTVDDNDTAETIGADGTLTLDAGKNLRLQRKGKVFTYGLESNLTGINSITGLANTLPVTKNDAAAPTTNQAAPTKVDGTKAASVNDILNAGWNLKENGAEKDFVKAYDTVNFVNGTGTTANVTVTENGAVSAVKFDVKKTTIAEDTAKPGTMKAGDTGDSFATANDVANAINNAYWTATSENDGGVLEGNKTEEKVKAGDKVTFKAGENIKLKQAGKDFTYSLNPVLSNITSIGGHGTTMTFKDAGVDLGGKKITNIAPGTDGTDAVNKSQLDTAVQEVAAKPLSFSGDNKEAGKFDRTLGTEVKIVGGETEASKLSDNNIGVIGNKTDTLTVKLAKSLKGLSDVEVKDDAGNTTNITPNGITISQPEKNGKKPDNVSLTKDGLNNGGQNITNVAGNLPGAKKDTTAPTTASEGPSATDLPNITNNAATVGDVLNAGWNLQNNGEAKDFVKPYDTVNFVDGKGTKAVVETTPNGTTSKVKFDIDTVDMTSNPNGTVKNPMGDNVKQLLDDLAAAKKAVADNPDDEAAKAKLKDAEDAVNKAGGNKIATAQNVANMINNSGFTLKADKTDGQNETSDETLKKDGELIKPGSTVTMKAGKNMTVKHEANGNITYATASNVTFDSVQFGENGPKITNKDGNINVGDKDGKPTQITGVASSLKTTPVETTPNGKDGAKPESKPNLIDLANATTPNAAATVGDLQNMGWVVGAPENGYVDTVKNANKVDFKGENGISVTGKTNKEGVREITISVAEGKVTNDVTVTKADGKVIDAVKGPDGKLYKKGPDGKPDTSEEITLAEGDKVNNEGSKFVSGNAVATAIQESGWNIGKADAKDVTKAFEKEAKVHDKVNPNDDVKFVDGQNTVVKMVTVDAKNENGSKKATTFVKVDVTGLPVQYTDKNGTPVTKVGDKYFTVDKDGNPTTTEVKPADLTTNMVNPAAAPNKIGEPTTLGNVKSNLPETKNGNNPTLNQTAPTDEDADKVKNNAATVSDVLNAGWNLQNNGKAKDFVKPYDTVNFVDGKGTKAVVKTEEDGTTSNVKFDIDTGSITNNADGSVQGPVTSEMQDALKDAKDAYNSLPPNAPEAVRKAAEQAVADAENNIANAKNKVATAQDVADAINKSGFTLTTSANGGEKISGTPEVINPGKKVEMVAGKNMTVKQESNGKVTYATASNVTFDSVQFGDNGPKITNNGGNIHVGTATGAPTKITGVAPGEISATSKDAVNGSQLHAMGNKLQGQINKLGNRMNAGMATSAAMANLLQPHKPGQSVATAGVGQHKNQSAVAVGYSRISDNGKYGIRFSMGANTQGEVTSGAAVGYFW
ncbi:ESPR-type extended signal peptide-containing protein [Haemophilus parainfluenzae]|uniref:Hemophilus surface fibril n=1 Tax=Haemophilus parainfluenzae TaxID=729 RepID=A0A377JJZ8_HAEPA|nr:ESPR-type extended signal peptide-containing protein [Haemophilus parainfluenzae]STP06079.1 hemophilus surface fibril [Haemophilus parainfluenzae]